MLKWLRKVLFLSCADGGFDGDGGGFDGGDNGFDGGDIIDSGDDTLDDGDGIVEMSDGFEEYVTDDGDVILDRGDGVEEYRSDDIVDDDVISVDRGDGVVEYIDNDDITGKAEEKAADVNPETEEVPLSPETEGAVFNPETGEMEMSEELRQECYKHTPVRHGSWVGEDGQHGERGDSMWVSDKPEVQETLERFGVEGIRYKGGLPDLEPVSIHEVYLNEDELQIRNKAQFEVCNDILAEDIENLPEWRENMQKSGLLDDDQLAEIEMNEVPYGYVWHHDPNIPGRMLLVPISVHDACKHVGGQKLWGGGNANR